MFISIILEVISIRNKNNLPLTRETVGTHPIEEVEADEDNIGPAMCIKYVDADKTRFVISIVASCIDHQMYLPICRYEALIEGFLTLVSVLNSVSD